MYQKAYESKYSFPANISCSKSPIETAEKDVKYVQS